MGVQKYCLVNRETRFWEWGREREGMGSQLKFKFFHYSEYNLVPYHIIKVVLDEHPLGSTGLIYD